MRDEIAELVKHARIRNRLLMAKTVQAELAAAAERVVRLSDPGTPERFFALAEVARDSGLPASEIVRAILKAKSRRAAHQPAPALERERDDEGA